MGVELTPGISWVPEKLIGIQTLTSQHTLSSTTSHYETWLIYRFTYYRCHCHHAECGQQFDLPKFAHNFGKLPTSLQAFVAEYACCCHVPLYERCVLIADGYIPALVIISLHFGCWPCPQLNIPCGLSCAW